MRFYGVYLQREWVSSCGLHGEWPGRVFGGKTGYWSKTNNCSKNSALQITPQEHAVLQALHHCTPPPTHTHNSQPRSPALQHSGVRTLAGPHSRRAYLHPGLVFPLCPVVSEERSHGLVQAGCCRM